jgi:hypothetical protein
MEKGRNGGDSPVEWTEQWIGQVTGLSTASLTGQVTGQITGRSTAECRVGLRLLSSEGVADRGVRWSASGIQPVAVPIVPNRRM